VCAVRRGTADAGGERVTHTQTHTDTHRHTHTKTYIQRMYTIYAHDIYIHACRVCARTRCVRHVCVRARARVCVYARVWDLCTSMILSISSIKTMPFSSAFLIASRSTTSTEDNQSRKKKINKNNQYNSNFFGVLVSFMCVCVCVCVRARASVGMQFPPPRL